MFFLVLSRVFQGVSDVSKNSLYGFNQVFQADVFHKYHLKK